MFQLAFAVANSRDRDVDHCPDEQDARHVFLPRMLLHQALNDTNSTMY